MYEARIYVTLRRGVLDPQGDTIKSGLQALGFGAVRDVRMGKFLVVRLEAETEEKARLLTDEMCRKLLANPVIEDSRFEIALVS